MASYFADEMREIFAHWKTKEILYINPGRSMIKEEVNGGDSVTTRSDSVAASSITCQMCKLLH